MATAKPDLTRIWAEGAPGANVIDPDTTTPGKVSAGWSAEIPPFEHFNFLQKWYTAGLAHANEQGIMVWDTNTTYPVNGLSKGSDGEVYKAVLEQSGNNPVGDGGTNWATAFTGGTLPTSSTRNDLTLTAALTTDLTGSSVIEAQGYSIDSDGGDGRWIFTGTVTPGSASTENLAIRVFYDAVGRQYKYNDLIVNPIAFGIKGSGLDGDAANNSTRLNALLSSNPGRIHFKYTGDSYKFNASSECTNSISITSDTGVIIDCTITGYTGGYWIRFTGALPQIGDLSTAAVKGERTVVFSAAPALTVGQVFVIYNPTNSSWSNFKTSFKAGEYCKVVSISGNTVTVANELYDDYVAASVDVYRFDGIRVHIDGLEFKGDVANSLIDLKYCLDSVINNTKYTHKNNSCVAIFNSYNILVTDTFIHNEGDGGDDYGVLISNSQSIHVSGGVVYSRRHAVTAGGDALIGSVPCRDIRISNMTLSNDVASGTQAADFHGNTENSSYDNCEIYGGATWQGKNVGYNDCRIGAISVGVCLLSSEIKGGLFYLRNCQLHSTVNPFGTGRGVIDIGGNSTNVVTIDTVEDCLFEVTNCSISGKNFSAFTSMMLLNNRGATVATNFKINGLDLDCNDINNILFTRTISGTANSDFIIIDNITSKNFTGKQFLNHNDGTYLNFPHRLQRQSGSDVLTTSTSANFASGTPVVFKWIYPRLPNFYYGRSNLGYIGNRIGIVHGNPATVTGLTPIINTDDAVNFSAVANVDVSWMASIDEV